MLSRQTAIKTAIGMKGQRDEVAAIYNSYLPHPRGYIVKADSDMLCATYVSAIFIELDKKTGKKWTAIVPPECGARQLYRNMDAISSATDNVKRVPTPGDIIFFGTKSKPDGINHTGIVVDVTNNNRRIVYYDISTSGRVGQHYIPVGDAWICGYGIPDYASMDVPAPAPTPTPDPPAHEFAVGDLVNINPGARWYRGQSIKLSCINDKWYICSLRGDRAVLGMNEAETRNIQSPIHTADITLVVPYNTDPVPANDKVTITITIKPETKELMDIIAAGNNMTLGEVIDKQFEDFV